MSGAGPSFISELDQIAACRIGPIVSVTRICSACLPGVAQLIVTLLGDLRVLCHYWPESSSRA